MNHYSEEIDLNKVVRDYGISPSRFRAIFKHQMNRAPLEYIIDYRMEQAKKLFMTGKYNISEVGYICTISPAFSNRKWGVLPPLLSKICSIPLSGVCFF